MTDRQRSASKRQGGLLAAAGGLKGTRKGGVRSWAWTFSVHDSRTVCLYDPSVQDLGGGEYIHNTHARPWPRVQDAAQQKAPSWEGSRSTSAARWRVGWDIYSFPPSVGTCSWLCGAQRGPCSFGPRRDGCCTDILGSSQEVGAPTNVVASRMPTTAEWRNQAERIIRDFLQRTHRSHTLFCLKRDGGGHGEDGRWASSSGPWIKRWKRQTTGDQSWRWRTKQIISTHTRRTPTSQARGLGEGKAGPSWDDQARCREGRGRETGSERSCLLLGPPPKLKASVSRSRHIICNMSPTVLLVFVYFANRDWHSSPLSSLSPPSLSPAAGSAERVPGISIVHPRYLNCAWV